MRNWTREGSGPASQTRWNYPTPREISTVPAISSSEITENTETARHPKCNLTNARSMEFFRRLGLSQMLRSTGLPPELPRESALELGIAHPRRGDVNRDNALPPRLRQQPRDFRDRDADQRGNFRLALLLEVVQFGHPAQQLVLLVGVRFVNLRSVRRRRVYHHGG